MRKKLLIAAAIILLLLLSFIGMLQYRQYSSYKVPVHAGAQTIIKVNVDDFIKIFLRNYGLDFKKKPPSTPEFGYQATFLFTTFLPLGPVICFVHCLCMTNKSF